MDSRFFWIMVALMAGLLGWSYMAPTPAKPPQTATATPAQATPVGATASQQEPTQPQSPTLIATKSITVTTPEYIAVFDEAGGRLSSFKMTHYSKRKINKDMPNELMDLVTMPQKADWPMRLTMTDPNAPALAEAPFIADHESLTIGEGKEGQLTMTYQDPGGFTVVRTFTFYAGSYLIDQKVTLENKGSMAYGGFVTMRMNTAPFNGKPGYYDEMAAYINNTRVADTAEDAASALEDFRGKLQVVSWIGYMDQYFLTALVPGDTSETPGVFPPGLSAHYQDHGGLAINASQPVALAPAQTAVYNFNFYYGPKSKPALHTAGNNLIESIDMGWFSFLATPLATLLVWIYSWVGNYGLAIIIVTVLIKLALWPLTAKSYRSMKEMQKLQPKILKIREKYADDKEAMNREIMHMYKTFKVNPLGGCLPMLLQIPFFIAFYRVLDSLLELRGAPFVFWIQDLAAPDRLFNFGFTIPFFEPPTGIPVLTLLMGASMVWQQRMTPNTMGDPIQAKVMMMMPVVFTIILVNMPAGLVLYWLVNNILSIAQQRLVNKSTASAS